MASTHKHIRSSTANKRPTTAIADGQVALNTNASSPGLFFKDSTGASIIKIGPVHVGSTAPNATPGAGGSAGNSTGEVWLDNSLSPVGVKIWDGSAWVNATPAGSTTVQGLLELATDAETQAGSDTARAVTSAGLQSKVSDSTSTTSSTTIASSTAVKSAYDLANAALPLSGGTITGNLEIGTTGSLSFEGSTADAFETTIAVTNPTADRTITLPDTTGTVVTTGDTGTVTSTMLLDGTIVNADVNASAAIAGTKISPDFGSQTITTTGVFSHALGAAATPSITFTGDLNTGIYSPGADQVAVATNGVGRLFVDATGRVGIGATPTARLHLQTTSENAVLQMLENNGSTVHGASIDAFNSSGGNIRLRLHDSGGTFQERLRITSAGLVGVGTSSPSTLLELSEDQGTTITLRRNNSAAVADDLIGKIDFFNNDGSAPGARVTATVGAYAQSTAGGTYLSFSTATNAGSNTERMRITSAGLVGIGTTSATANLELGTAGSANQTLRINAAANNYLELSTTGTTGEHKITAGNSASGTAQLIFETASGGTESERARIDSSGRLLVGTSTAGTNYYPSSAARTPAVQFVSSGNNNGLTITRSDGGPVLYIASSDNVTTVDRVYGQINFLGFDGANHRSGASIVAAADATTGSGDMPGRLVFSVTADGAATPTEALRISSNRAITVSDGGNVVLGTTTGTKIGTSTSQKIGFFNETPIVQPTTGIAEAAFVENSGGTAVNVDSTFGGYTIQQVVQALQNLGLLA